MVHELLKQADTTLSKCGRPVMPAGLSVVPLFKGFLLQAVVPFAAAQTIVKEITGDAIWALRAISITVSAGTTVYIQVQLPNGRFLINDLQDVREIGGFGSYRYLFTKELDCVPGAQLRVTFDPTLASAVADQPVAVLFEGAYKYTIKSDVPAGPQGSLASQLPRYLGTPNQNILAPCWMSGEVPAVPAGCDDDPFMYSSQPTQILAAGPAFAATATIPIDRDSDFICRRLLFDVTSQGGAAGTFLCRIRVASGYALTDDYIDAALYIGSSPMAHDWRISRGDEVDIDLQLVDVTAGAPGSSMTIQVHLDGVKRRKS